MQKVNPRRASIRAKEKSAKRAGINPACCIITAVWRNVERSGVMILKEIGRKARLLCGFKSRLREWNMVIGYPPYRPEGKNQRE